MRPVVGIIFCAVVCFAKPVPPFRGDLLGGGTLSLKETLSPNKHVLLSFWATWCTACIEELTAVTEKMRSLPNLPLKLVTINVDLADSASDVRPTMKLYNFSFPVVLDPQHQIFSKYRNDKSLPYSVLIAPGGDLLRSFQGYSDTLFQEI